MPSFDTPQPISVTVEFGVGDLRVAATDRTDTVVDVRPTDPTKKSDVAAAEQTQVEYANGALLVKAPRGRGWRSLGPRKGSESVDIVIEVPAGSHLLASAGIGGLHTTGRLGECRYNTGAGDIQIHDASAVDLRTGVGDIAVDHITGHADIKTGSGAVRIGTIAGSAVIRNSNGDTWAGEVTDDVRVNSANGRIVIDRAGATVTAKTANGDIRLGAVVRGAVVAHTALGKIDIGIETGVAAWLDVNTSFGAVVNGLDAAEKPEPGAGTVEVRARTSFGDITIHRAAARIAAPSVE
ncbi:MAG: DUF4097 family beta strand repeat-containing protein [Candidatus Dormiibacterota bacterium]